MNFLAHLFLAGEDDGLLIGNFIADAIRGKEIEAYSEEIRRGIVLHRKIDSFTDTHPVVRQTVARLRKSSAKYAPVVSDVVFDHFLAHNWVDYSPIPLTQYAREKYDLLNKNKGRMPNDMQLLLSYMERQNWLVNYADLYGIEETLKKMSTRASFVNNMASAVQDLRADYESFRQDFQLFFPDIQEYVKNEIRALG
jgi:acyl carrier protein phosphodiesterase